MKKGFVLVIFLTLFFSSIVSSISTDIRDTYQPRETIIGHIQGNILEPINKGDLILKRNNVQIPIEYDIARLGSEYYFYIIAPENEGNYTIIINNIATTQNAIPAVLNYTKSITIEGNTTKYTTKPGFIISRGQFEIHVIVNTDEQQDVSISYPESHTQSFGPGDTTLSFNINAAIDGTSQIMFGRYTLPLYAIKEAETKQQPIVFFPQRIYGTFLKNQDKVFPIRFVYRGKNTLKDFNINYDKSIFTISSIPSSIEPNSSIDFNLTVKGSSQDVYKTITFSSGNETFDLPVQISYTSNESQITHEENISQTGSGYYCSELGGVSCNSGETCSLPTLESIDIKACCPGICTKPKSSYSWVGYVLGSVLLVVLVFILFRYYRTKKTGNPLASRISAVEKSNRFTS